jgi:CIC family chloride channel protein
VAISGASWLPDGWGGVEILLLLCVAKLVASSLTIGSGGSAGDFAPSLVLGGVFGGAFGRALQLLLHDPRIDPGAFALVGMGTFYGGIAHAPLSSLIMVCELAGSYDLLVPLMLAEGIAFVALRRWSLYHAQVPTKRDSPAHRGQLILDVLGEATVKDVMTQGRPFVHFDRRTRVAEVLAHVTDNTWQDAFPVLDEAGAIVGTITTDELRVLHAERELAEVTIAADVMQPPVTARASEDLRTAIQRMIERGLREVPVVDEGNQVIGFLDEADIARSYLEATRKPTSTPPPK